eukprot:g16012.t1
MRLTFCGETGRAMQALHVCALIGVQVVALSFLVLGRLYCGYPTFAADMFGLPLSSPADVSWVLIAGLRDFSLGLLVCSLLYSPHRAALRALLPGLLVVPIGDAALVLHNGAAGQPSSPGGDFFFKSNEKLTFDGLANHVNGAVAMALLTVALWCDQDLACKGTVPLAWTCSTKAQAVAHYLVVVGAHLLGLGLLALGVLCVVDAVLAADMFGIPLSSPADVSWVLVAGLRDLSLGLIVCSLYFSPHRAALRAVLPGLLVVPIGDAALVLHNGEAGLLPCLANHVLGGLGIAVLTVASWFDITLDEGAERCASLKQHST